MQTTSLDVEVARLRFELKAARSEISKLHKQMNQLQKTVRRELAATRRAALDAVAASAAAAGTQPAAAAPSMPAAPKAGGGMCMVPVGHIESCFLTRNGTPRQPGLAPSGTHHSHLRVSRSPRDLLHAFENCARGRARPQLARGCACVGARHPRTRSTASSNSRTSGFSFSSIATVAMR